MLPRDYTDVFGGLLLLVVGAGFAWYSAENYDIGTLRRMGPGMFPMGIGCLLAVFGVLLGVPALFRAGETPEIRVWSPIFVLSGVAAFALVIRPFGLIPAILAVTIISSLAELRVRPVSLAALCLALCLIAWLTFRVGLGLPISMFRWPF